MLRENVNEVDGVEIFKLKDEGEPPEEIEIKDCEEAVISFWRLNSENLFRCVHQFTKPNPMKREVISEDGKVIS